MINFEDIQKANESIKTTNIKGKDYAEVNQRIKAFRMVYPEGCIKTSIVHLADGICVIKAEVGYYIYGNNDEFKTFILLGTGTAYEKENSTFINKTSYIENCETSAVGRALGMAGFGIDTSVASAEEVQNAILQQNEEQDEGEKTIPETWVNALYDIVKNNAVEKDEVMATLMDKGYTKFADIKIKDYKNIIKHFENFRRN